ncbi:tripartite tricarboxylate transporter TctB family protein [Paenibacillus sp. URB8-2]|uniref:tripartite tricarboxylate transporter TctB family protein n=1 Tax=Paenibacillus sp. URB8-2 TaxID=2741301 RepID=UPI0015BE2AC9|nr:tripartite tricarboxylate transporter TctB family protein [Paenibacillus sp. URB8-2]
MADKIFSIVTLTIAGIFLINSRLFAEKSGTQAVSSAFFPRIIIYALIFSSLILLVSSFLKKSKQQGEGAKGASIAFLRHHWRVPFMFAWFMIYLILMPILGFFPSTVLFLFVGYLVLNVSFVKKKLFLYIPLSLILTFVIQFIFENELQVILP